MARRKVHATVDNENFMEDIIKVLAESQGLYHDPTGGPGRPNPLVAYPSDKVLAMFVQRGGYAVSVPNQLKVWQEEVLTRFGAQPQEKKEAQCRRHGHDLSRGRGC